jgi:hypothetical protein
MTRHIARSVTHFSRARNIHSSPLNRQLVGPPDPVSHLRPVIYDDKPELYPIQHPYSLHEFRDPAKDTNEHEDDFGNYELKLRTAQLDAFSHQFWTEVRVSLTFLKLKMNSCSHRPTLGLKQPKPLSWMPCPHPLVRTIASRHSHISTSSGWSMSRHVSRCTPPSCVHVVDRTCSLRLGFGTGHGGLNSASHSLYLIP